MTSIITAWLVKLATRILRSQLEGLHSKIDYLDQNLDTALAEHRRQSQQLKAEAELAHSRGLQLCDALGRIETLSNRCDTFRSQMLDQAATIRDYQLEKENLCCTIDVLQANVSGWSKLFATLEHQVGTSRETAVRLRREIDVFTVRKDSTTGAGSASQASDPNLLPGPSLMGPQTSVETEQESADSWAAVEAVEAVGAPRCLTEKQVFVMSYLAVRAHSFRTIEGFIDNKVMAAIHTDAEKLWDMLQKGLEKG